MMTSKNTTTWGQWGDRRGMGEQFGGLIYVFIYRATALPLPVTPIPPVTEKLLHRRPFTQKTFYTEDLLHKKSFYTEDSQESQD